MSASIIDLDAPPTKKKKLLKTLQADSVEHHIAKEHSLLASPITIPQGFQVLFWAQSAFPFDPEKHSDQFQKLTFNTPETLRTNYISILRPTIGPPEFWWTIVRHGLPTFQQVPVQYLKYFHSSMPIPPSDAASMLDDRGLPLYLYVNRYDQRFLQNFQMPQKLSIHSFGDNGTFPPAAKSTPDMLPRFHQMNASFLSLPSLPVEYTVDISSLLWRSLHELRLHSMLLNGEDHFDLEQNFWDFPPGTAAVAKTLFAAWFCLDSVVLETGPVLVSAEKRNDSKFKTVIYDVVRNEQGKIMYIQCSHVLLAFGESKLYRIIPIRSQVLEKQTVRIRADKRWYQIRDVVYQQDGFNVNKNESCESLTPVLQSHGTSLQFVLKLFHYFFPYEKPSYQSPLSFLVDSRLPEQKRGKSTL